MTFFRATEQSLIIFVFKSNDFQCESIDVLLLCFRAVGRTGSWEIAVYNLWEQCGKLPLTTIVRRMHSSMANYVSDIFSNGKKIGVNYYWGARMRRASEWRKQNRNWMPIEIGARLITRLGNSKTTKRQKYQNTSNVGTRGRGGKGN